MKRKEIQFLLLLFGISLIFEMYNNLLFPFIKIKEV